jgi:hypothetical protein
MKQYPSILPSLHSLTILLAAFGASACAAGSEDSAAASTTEFGSDAAADAGAQNFDTAFVPESLAQAATASVGAFKITVGAVTSSTLALSWAAVPGASRVVVIAGTEPAASLAAALPAPTLPRYLAGTATSVVLGPAAAGTDVFVEVKIERTGNTPLVARTHARTKGGPGAVLNTPLRSVHGYGPNTLMLVLSDPNTTFSESARTHAGNDGAAWKGGSWQVARANGSRITVTNVYRQTVPVGQPNYPVGYEQYGNGNIVDLEHRIFLVLNAPIGSRELLRVRHVEASTPLDVYVPFSDRYLETPLIQVNQVGYNPRATKRWAYVAGYLGDGGASSLAGIGAQAELLLDDANDLVPATVVRVLPVSVRAEADADSGGKVLQVDLASAPPAEGKRYRVRVPGVGISWPTSVSEAAVFKAFYATARGLFHNRWCGDLTPATTEWSRGPDHCSAYWVTGKDYRIGQFPKDTSKADQRPLRGGHHDAGDFDIRPYHVVVGEYVMRGIELGKANLADGQLNLPESGNGIPDLLDEALWSLAGWEQLQNTDGSIRSGVESYADPRGIYYADQDQLPYWTWDPVAWHTAYVAALFAQGSRLVKPYNAARATALLAASRKAYDAAVRMNAPNSYRLYAASELYAATGEAKYKTAFEAAWNAINKYGRGAFDNIDSMLRLYPGSFTDHTPVMADYVMGYAQTPGADAAIIAIINREMKKLADESAAWVLESAHAHRNGRPLNDNLDWGHATATGRHVDRIYQALQVVPLDACDETAVLRCDERLGGLRAGRESARAQFHHGPRVTGADAAPASRFARVPEGRHARDPRHPRVRSGERHLRRVLLLARHRRALPDLCQPPARPAVHRQPNVGEYRGVHGLGKPGTSDRALRSATRRE